MDNVGWISLHRKLRDHWLWQKRRVFSDAEAWIDILLDSQPIEEEKKNKKDILKVGRGQTITTLGDLSAQWSWNKSKVRRFLKILVDDEMVKITTDSKNTIITISNYEHYQFLKSTMEKTGPKKSIEERKEKFKELLFPFLEKFGKTLPFLEKFGKTLFNEFYEYWVEHGPKDKKMRFEKETSFAISRRLGTFKKNNNKFNKSDNNKDKRNAGEILKEKYGLK